MLTIIDNFFSFEFNLSVSLLSDELLPCFQLLHDRIMTTNHQSIIGNEFVRALEEYKDDAGKFYLRMGTMIFNMMHVTTVTMQQQRKNFSSGQRRLKKIAK